METATFDGLIEGYSRFRNGGWQRQHDRWLELADGQSPKVMVIACSDSRVDPAQIFDVSPGEIFVVRNVAALAPPFETTPGHHGVSAALEYAVTVLQVSDIFVMGHGACGGVRAALERPFAGRAPGEGGFVTDWVSMLDGARAEVVAQHGEGEDAVHPLELAGVRTSLANLRTFPFVAEREAAGTLTLHGGWFGIAGGQLHLLDEASGTFSPAAG